MARTLDQKVMALEVEQAHLLIRNKYLDCLIHVAKFLNKIFHEITGCFKLLTKPVWRNSECPGNLCHLCPFSHLKDEITQ